MESKNDDTLGFLGETSIATDAQAVRNVWRDIAQRKITMAVDIREALTTLPFPIDEFIAIGVMSFACCERDIAYGEILTNIQRFFPNSNATVYCKDVLIILTYSDRTFRRRAPLKQDELDEFLAKHHACLGISNTTRKPDGLLTQFNLTKRSLVIARALNADDKKKRIFYYEDYSTYCMIDMCVQRFLETSGNTDLIYLTHPAVVALERYDVAHKTDLRKVLYQYLINDRNVTKTADSLFMHRNTVINKIRNIKSLLDVDLDNHELRERLVLSCQTVEYYRKVVGKNLEL